jgi:UDP-N-acetylglucosamine--N-acetylmuramyl-(pentapeptide) pyrophosphoryl-undecaprenol N-acetylglucosamine transferase
VPSVLVPYPYDRAQHQRANAEVLERAGAAVIVDDQRDPQRNAYAIGAALTDPLRSEVRRERMRQAARSLARPDAADRIAAFLLGLANLPAGAA